LLDGGAIVLKEIEAGAALENCRRLINQINAGLSAKEPFVDVSSATEFLSCLESATSALKRSVSRSRKRGETKIACEFDSSTPLYPKGVGGMYRTQWDKTETKPKR
jgi:hypothetical protein